MSKMIASAKIGETLNPQIVALAKLGLSDAEIEQVLADDKRIDKGEKLFELSAEQKEVEKKMKNTGSKAPTAYKFQKRERKADNDKSHLISCVRILLEGFGCPVNVINKEREIEFVYNDRKFKIVLSAPRS